MKKQAHDPIMDRPHSQGRAVHCSCGEVFTGAGLTALLAQMEHRDDSLRPSPDAPTQETPDE